MKILITGATGFIGKRLCEALVKTGHQVVALSRNPQDAQRIIPAISQAFAWDAQREYAPFEAFSGVDSVIHLAGESVAGRWTKEKKQRISKSRILGTKHLVDMMGTLKEKPTTFLCVSAIGYYGNQGEATLTEASPPGSSFLAQVCQGWEVKAQGVETLHLRIGIVLGSDGGALKKMLLPAKFGVFGPLGSGTQWWSWVHLDDVVGLILHVLDHPTGGVLNVTAPNPVRQKEFAKQLGQALGRPAFFPTPALALKLALGEFSTELLSSAKALPKRAQAMGYDFKFPDLAAALRDILR